MNLDKKTYLYKNAYLKLSPSSKRFLGSIYGRVPLRIRFGKHYAIHQKIIEKFENSDRQYQLDFVFHKTIETINYAYENVPYYQTLLNEHGLNIDSFKDLSDIRKIPNLTKEIIREKITDLYTDKDYTPVKQFTGGSTFSPTKFYLPLETSRGKEKAYINYIFGKLGYLPRDKMIQFRGRRIEHGNKYWEYEPVENHLLISANHIEEEYIEQIVNAINRFDAKYFYGYPSAIAKFVKICKRNNVQVNNDIQGVFLISENVLRSDIDNIRSFFNCSVLAHYGHSERCSTGYSINGDKYNILNSYGLTRVVDNEIITTSFDNFVMPFINYKLNDYVGGKIDYYDNTDCTNGIKYIGGRIQEFLVDKNRHLLSATQMPSGNNDIYEFIDGIQFYQEKIGHIIVRIKTKHHDIVDIFSLKKEFSSFFGDEFTLDLQFVENIEKTPRGKSMIVIQKLDIRDYLHDKK